MCFMKPVRQKQFCKHQSCKAKAPRSASTRKTISGLFQKWDLIEQDVLQGNGFATWKWITSFNIKLIALQI